MRSRLWAPARLSLVLSALLFTVGCGSYETTKVKNYKLHVVNGTPSQVKEFRALISAFNTLAGVNALTYVDEAAEANSPIKVVQGLKLQTGNKVGLGQWLADTEQESPLTTVPGDRPRRTVRFSMSLQFDADYFARYAGDDVENTYERQKLFFHEVGHGLELDHSPVRDHLMYEEISGRKTDFTEFFRYVRSYMADT